MTHALLTLLLLATPEPGAAAVDSAGAIAGALVGDGFENVAVDPGPSGPRAAWEDRRHLHAAAALGRAAARTGTPATMIPHRLGLPVAELALAPGEWPPQVTYPSDRRIPAPAGPRAADTRFRTELMVRPLFDYALGRLYDPVLVRVALQPELRTQPWPGARARVSWVFPLRDDFAETPLAPDVNRSRPGPLTLEQFAWLPGAGLGSATGGLFGQNRWGFSLGFARPLAGGAWLLDAQLDATGFWAASDSGLTYSEPSRTSGHVGVTWRPPLLDVALRLRGARYLYGDQGVELELERSLGDLDVAFFALRSDGVEVAGVRLGIPVPPLVRPAGRFRVVPPERITLLYRDQAAPFGTRLDDVASHEAFLRQLSAPSLTANRDRFAGDRPAGEPDLHPVSWVGMTGFVTTPWCGVQPDRHAEIGYAKVPRMAAWDHRGEHANEVYYASLGFLPRLEVGLRWTVLPGLRAFRDVAPDSPLTDSDRMVSGRIALIEPRGARPGLAAGIEDALGTRRFHATYVVTGATAQLGALRGRAGLGYAFRAIEATRHRLDGAFAGVELSEGRFVSAALEHDSERWNAALGLHPGLGLHLRAALFDLRYLGLGAGWSRAL